MSPLSDRPQYSREQLSRWLKWIHKDPAYTLESLEADIKSDPLNALTRLHTLQVAANPWGVSTRPSA